MRNKHLKIGVIIGEGCGRELALIFKNFIYFFSKKYNLDIQCNLVNENQILNSYYSKKNISNYSFTKELNIAYDIFDKAFTENDLVFRTGIDAELLYSIRQKYKAIKTIPVFLNNQSVFIVRDEFQGYYSNNSKEYHRNRITFHGEFTFDNYAYLNRFCLNKGREFFNNEAYDFISINKFHLFYTEIENWLNKINPKIQLYQPDTGISNLLEGNFNSKNLLLLVSNEVGDVIYEFILNKLNKTKNTQWTKNHYSFQGRIREVYQTVHGSADDIKNKDLINPISTIKIAAEIVDDYYSLNSSLSLKGILKNLSFDDYSSTSKFISDLKEKLKYEK